MRTGFTWRGWLVVWLLPVTIVALNVAVLVATRPAVMPVTGGNGAGDPYYPDAGASGYDARRYTIRLVWDEATGTLSGTTRMEAVATADLARVHLDLAHPVGSASVDGRPAAVTVGPGDDRALAPAQPVPAGRAFAVEVAYTAEVAHTAEVGRMAGEAGEDPVRRQGRELVIAGEPESSSAWFAANDHPSDDALVEVFVTVPAGLEALSTGRLVSADADDDPDTATWHWVADEPLATYLTFLAVGEFTLERTDADGRQVVLAVSDRLPAAQRDRAWTVLRRTPATVAELAERYGPYPFSQLGGVVVGVDLWFDGLETQTRPVYSRTIGREEADAEGLLVHELAHMWFGDHVRVRTWDDIVNNEGWATFATEDLLAARRGGDLSRWLQRRWDAAPPDFWRPSLSDPGIANMFGTTYGRGAMALAALRNVVGEEPFAALAREWAQTPGSRSLEDFQAFVGERTGLNLRAFWAAWYDAPQAPPRTPAFGYPQG